MTPIIKKILNGKQDFEMAWEDFIDSALYDLEFGYYRLNRKRVGGDGADFYTSSSLKEKVFSELIKEAAENILISLKKNPADFQFVEIGAEPETRIIENSIVFRLGENISIPKNAILISNELFDARPFSRFKFIGGGWKKGFAKITPDSISEFFKDADSSDLDLLKKYFPKAQVENFRIDISFNALSMLNQIAAQDWQGLFIFADYFRTSEELSALPNGTARAYQNHKDFSDITIDAGNADITSSPCSDIISDILKSFNFTNQSVETQESFFIKNSPKKIEDIIKLDVLNPRKRELVQLLNPVYMGAAFRIISAARI